MRVMFIAIFGLIGIPSMFCAIKDERYEPLLRCRDYVFQIHPLIVLVDAKNGKKLLFPQNKLDKDGVVKIDKKQRIILHCPGPNNYLIMDPVKQVVNLVTDTFPTEFRTSYEFSRGICPTKKMIENSRCLSPFLVDIKTNEDKKCANDKGILLTAGFTVKPFIELYKICFDPKIMLPIYTTHKLLGTMLLHIKRRNLLGIHVNVVNTDVLPLERPGRLYIPKVQEAILNKLFGNEQASKYLRLQNKTGRLFMAAPLTPPGDFYFHPVKTATYVYENSIPVFNSILFGNLDLAEVVGKSLAIELEMQDKSLDVASGWFDLLELPDKEGNQKFIYLDDESELAQYRPVPKYLYKIFYDNELHLGIAIVILNNPFVQKKDKVEFPCKDVSKDFMEFNIFSNEPSAGLTRVCDVNDLVSNKLDYLQDLKITGGILKLDVNHEHFPKYILRRKEMQLNKPRGISRGRGRYQAADNSRGGRGFGRNQPASTSGGRSSSRGRGY